MALIGRHNLRGSTTDSASAWVNAAAVIAHYVLDADQPLTATTGSNTTFYLYGLGAIAEKTDAWSYSLPDGTNTPRQLVNLSGGITHFQLNGGQTINNRELGIR